MYNSVDDMLSFFQGILLLDCLESFAPVKTVSCNSFHHQPTPWLGLSLLEAIKRKQQAKRRAELSSNSNDIIDYKHLTNYLKI